MRVLNRISLLLLPLLLVIAASSQANTPHSFSGVVVNSINGQPISRALVQLGAEHAALTDHEGRFEFENVTEGSGAAIVSKPGYFAKGSGVTPLDRPAVLQLIPEAIVSGTITDSNGQPLQDLRIQLKMLQARNGLSHWQQIQSTTTNVEGEFRFAGLQAGKYTLATGFHIDGLPEATSSVAFVPIVYPPLEGDGSGGALTLKPGDHVEAQLSPPVEKLYPVTGIVPGPPGRGGGFQVETRDGEVLNPPTRFFRESGAFRMMLPSGSYRLIVHSAVGPEQLIGMREISVGHAALDGVTVSLEPQVSIPVEVEFQAVTTGSQDTQATAPHFNVSLQDDDPAGQMRILPAQPEGAAAGQDSGGPLVIRNVEPGRYELQADTMAPWYVASASCGDVDLTRDPLVIGLGVAPCTIHAVLHNDSGSLKWSVVAADASHPESETEPVSVIAIPLGNLTQTAKFAGSQRLATAVSPAQGSFENLAPGRYLVIALSHPRELPYRDVAVLQRYLPLGKEVTLSANGKAEVQLNMVVGEP